MSLVPTILFNEMSNRWSQPKTYVEAILLIALISIALVFMVIFIKRPRSIIAYSIVIAILLLCFIFDMEYAFFGFSLVAIIFTMAFMFVNMGEIRKFLVLKPSNNSKDFAFNSIDKEMKKGYVDKITEAVKSLSNSKTGAIITIERSINLDEYIKTGTVINCPITPELLETIFYEGTRLHDGAAIIRGGLIVAAAVFFQPSNRGLTGKYGARHRAALGIAEVSDSITIVVSEETGRVSLAYNGVLESVVIDEFADALNKALEAEYNGGTRAPTSELTIEE